MDAELFISYARKDRDQVLPWLQQLQEAGVSLWLDEADIDGAHLWTGEITQAIRACRVLALLLSPASAASEQVLREVTLALEEHKAICPYSWSRWRSPRRWATPSRVSSRSSCFAAGR